MNCNRSHSSKGCNPCVRVRGSSPSGKDKLFFKKVEWVLSLGPRQGVSYVSLIKSSSSSRGGFHTTAPATPFRPSYYGAPPFLFGILSLALPSPSTAPIKNWEGLPFSKVSVFHLISISKAWQSSCFFMRRGKTPSIKNFKADGQPMASASTSPRLTSRASLGASTVPIPNEKNEGHPSSSSEAKCKVYPSK